MTSQAKYEIAVTKIAARIADAACIISFDRLMSSEQLNVEELKNFTKSVKRVEQVCHHYGFCANDYVRYGIFDDTFDNVRRALKLSTHKGENGEVIINTPSDEDELRMLDHVDNVLFE